MTFSIMMMIFFITMAATMSLPVSAEDWGPETIYFQEKAEELCTRSTPCGWYIYKTIDYHSVQPFKGPCECPYGTECKQYRDHLSISAYEYRCRPVKREADSGIQEEPDLTPQDTLEQLKMNVEEVVLKMKQLSAVVNQFIRAIKE